MWSANFSPFSSLSFHFISFFLLCRSAWLEIVQFADFCFCFCAFGSKNITKTNINKLLSYFLFYGISSSVKVFSRTLSKILWFVEIGSNFIVLYAFFQFSVTVLSPIGFLWAPLLSISWPCMPLSYLWVSTLLHFGLCLFVCGTILLYHVASL